MSFAMNLININMWEQMVLVFAVAFYLVECFMGYKAIKWLVAIVGFVIGFLIGFIVTGQMYTNDFYIPTIVGIAAGICLALVAFKLYLVGVFIFCGTVACRAIANLPFGNDQAQYILKLVLCIAVFVIVGILAVKFAKFCIIAITAITGSINAVNLLRTPIVMLDNNMILRIAVIALLAIVGILIQKATNK